jgi:hypothetical protein
MNGVGSASVAELLELQPFGRLLLVLGGRVVSILAISALQCDDISHDNNPTGNRSPDLAFQRATREPMSALGTILPPILFRVLSNPRFKFIPTPESR